MPKPRNEETREEFLSRCIRMVVKEGNSQSRAIAMCHSIWKQERG